METPGHNYAIIWINLVDFFLSMTMEDDWSCVIQTLAERIFDTSFYYVEVLVVLWIYWNDLFYIRFELKINPFNIAIDSYLENLDGSCQPWRCWLLKCNIHLNDNMNEVNIIFNKIQPKFSEIAMFLSLFAIRLL